MPPSAQSGILLTPIFGPAIYNNLETLPVILQLSTIARASKPPYDKPTTLIVP